MHLGVNVLVLGIIAGSLVYGSDFVLVALPLFCSMIRSFINFLAVS
jgi:hypothetical protein